MYLCQKIHKVEWSGVLLYSVKGSIKDFTKLELTIEDVFPMDKGSTSATGYELGDEIIDYRMNNPASMSWKMGMIHSHHGMRAYFSGVDDSELSDNTEFHNYYLSLIVNNNGDMVAKVAFRGDIKGYECKDEQGKDWTLKLTKEKQAMFTFDCDIKVDKVYTKVPKSFAERTEEIIKQADTKHEKFAYEARKFEGNKHNTPGKYPLALAERFNSKHSNKKFQEWFEEEEETYNQSFNTPGQKVNKKDMTLEERYWDFTKYLLRFGEELDGIDTVENALEDLEIVLENIQPYIGKAITMYPALFEQYWDIFGEINTEVFITTTGEVLDILENYTGLFEVVEPLIDGLERMVEQMQIDV
jgi:proteasome lid subunit RPN8/RPN11